MHYLTDADNKNWQPIWRTSCAFTYAHVCFQWTAYPLNAWIGTHIWTFTKRIQHWQLICRAVVLMDIHSKLAARRLDIWVPTDTHLKARLDVWTKLVSLWAHLKNVSSSAEHLCPYGNPFWIGSSSADHLCPWTFLWFCLQGVVHTNSASASLCTHSQLAAYLPSISMLLETHSRLADSLLKICVHTETYSKFASFIAQQQQIVTDR